MTKGLPADDSFFLLSANTMRHGRTLVWLLGLLVWLSAQAQTGSFGVNFSSSKDPAVVTEPVTFQVTITNLLPIALFNAQIAAVIDGPVTIVGATNNFGGIAQQTNTIYYGILQILAGGTASVSYTLNATNHGTINHTLFFDATNAVSGVTNYSTRAIFGTARLAISASHLPVGAVVGDLVSYQLTVTNSGPSFTLGTKVTNTLPDGLQFLGVIPDTIPFTQKSRDVILSLGRLDANTTANLTLQVQPTNSGTLPIIASVGALGYDDPSTTNHVVETNFVASRPFPSDLQTVFLSDAILNLQTGLLEQRIRVTNRGNASVPVVRVLVDGLRYPVYNSVGTNYTSPFVTVPWTLGPNATVDLLLTYFSPERKPGPNPTLTALSVPAPAISRPAGTVVPITRIQRQPDGAIWLEFPATIGRQYAVLYGSTPSLANGAALPWVVAPGSKVQWIDYGPPQTAPPLSDITARFYEVIELTSP